MPKTDTSAPLRQKMLEWTVTKWNPYNLLKEQENQTEIGVAKGNTM